MNPSTTELTLNMQLPNIAAVSWAVQGDQLARRIQATLVDGSTPWAPETGYNGVVRYHKPDGTSGVYDADEDGNPAVTWVGNVATVAIVQQALTVPGTVLMQLEFYDGNASRITAFGWANNVQPAAVTDTEFLSTDYYNLLTLQIAGVLGASGHPPYINNTTKNWMVWDENTAAYIDSGISSVGEIGPAPSVTGTAYQYANSSSGTVPPTEWSNTRPATLPGTWQWTKTVITFDNESTTTLYNSAYQGRDGQGSPGEDTPLPDAATGTAGTADSYSREDHVHPLPMASGNAIDYIGASTFTATVYKIGRIALCSYVVRYASTIVSGTKVMKLPYNPAFSCMVNMTDISTGAVKAVNLDLNGELTPYNDFRANDWLEGNFVYFTE